jgi:urease accessory protein
MAECDDGRGLTLLQLWLSPAFPVGSFAFSHGLEWAHEAGDIRDLASLEAWLADLLAHGAPRNDAILLAAAWRAADGRDAAALRETNQLAIALAGSRERHLETTAQGNAFRAAVSAAWPAHGGMAEIVGDVAYPIAVAVAAAAHGLPLRAMLEAYLAGTTANLVSAAVRLGAVGQTDGQRVLAALLPRIVRLAEEAQGATLADLGGAALRSDIASLRHETQYTRLFRS